MSARKHPFVMPVLLVSTILPLSSVAADNPDSNTVNSNNRSEKIKALETQINQLETQINQNQKDTQNQFKQVQDAVKINGFISAAAAKNDGGSAEIAGIGDKINTNADSVMGLQLIIKGNEQLSVTTQFISRGLELHNTKTEWAFLTYRVTDEDALQAGRFRIPYYLFSESLDVRFSYPWVRLPIEVYNVPISSLEGFQWTHKLSYAGWQTDLSTYFGRGLAHDDVNKDDFILDRAWGAVWASTKADWTVRLSYNVGKIQVENLQSGGALDQLNTALREVGQAAADFNATYNTNERTDFALPMENLLGEYTNLSVSYDNSTWLVTTELAHLTLSKAIVPAGSSGYILFGKHFGKWLPHFTFAKFYTDYKNDKSRASFTNDLSRYKTDLSNTGFADKAAGIQQIIDSINLNEQTQQSYTLGLNYEVSNNLKLKWEAAQYNDFHGGTGRFDSNPGKRVGIYTFSMDAIF